MPAMGAVSAPLAVAALSRSMMSPSSAMMLRAFGAAAPFWKARAGLEQVWPQPGCRPAGYAAAPSTGIRLPQSAPRTLPCPEWCMLETDQGLRQTGASFGRVPCCAFAIAP